MKFQIYVAQIFPDGTLKPMDEPEEYTEDIYPATLEGATTWAENIIVSFNNGLHPGEKPRRLLSVKVIDAKAWKGEHMWQKSNLVTIVCGFGFYDTYKCLHCPVTGKRYGFGDGVVIDRKFKAAKYRVCPGPGKDINASSK